MSLDVTLVDCPKQLGKHDDIAPNNVATTFDKFDLVKRNGLCRACCISAAISDGGLAT